MVDVLYTDGVIAAREKYLLKDKISRMCSLSAEEAFRILTESSFGGGEGASVYEYDKLLSQDERAIDEFVREYATGNAEIAYLLAPRDFHNAKAFVKAEYLKCDPEAMLAPDSTIPVDNFTACFKSGDFSSLASLSDSGAAIADAISVAREYLKGDDVSGAEVGLIFERAMYNYLSLACRRNKLLKKLIIQKIDMTNILTFLRAPDEEVAKKGFIDGGRLSTDKLSCLFNVGDDGESGLDDTEYKKFVRACLAAKRKKLPMTDAERMRDCVEFDMLDANKYELKKNQPFLYYVFRRKLENENIRIIFVCLLSGMSEREIKVRLRGEC
jgi:V/A-type H+-transporting ATPase subunit C